MRHVKLHIHFRHAAVSLSLFILAVYIMTACKPQIPDSYKDVGSLPAIYPDYCGVTIPVNIAPLTFEMADGCDEMVARFTGGGQELVCGGNSVQPAIDDWRTLLTATAGKTLDVDVYARNGDQWLRYKPFPITVSKDSIDPWLSYRLISPSYVAYEELTLNQRCLEDYDERVMVDNMLCGTEKDGQCVNCHHYQQYNPQRMQFHARQSFGGTVIAYDGTLRKVNLRNDSILSAGVYPAWHPWLNFIVYSTNLTSQTFHTRDANKIEVFDSASDLIAYDVSKNELTSIECDTTEYEVFPCWAPDGKTIYYCSAHFEYNDSVSRDAQNIGRAKEVKYNIYKKSFNPETYAFGPRELVFRADSLDKSATLPRVSPDGRYLLFTMGSYGVFHIWHHDADLWLMDLQTGAARPWEEVNSTDTESYHSWSSNGRWVVLSSRRDDGGYTRPFFAHVDSDGKGSKPFELTQADPDYHRQFVKCYNIPEFMHGPVTITPQEFARILKGSDGKAAVYKGKK